MQGKHASSRACPCVVAAAAALRTAATTAGMHHGDAGPKAADAVSIAQGATTSGRTTNGAAAPSGSGSDTDDFHNRLLVEVGSLNMSPCAACAAQKTLALPGFACPCIY